MDAQLRGASGRGRAVPRARRLVGGVAADRAGRQGQGCNAARSQVALVMTERKPSVQEVRDFTRKAVAAVNFARPNFVERRAKAGILAQFQSAHAAAEIALGGFSGLVDRADDRQRFVLTVLALGDELSFWVFPKGSKAGTFRSMRPRRSSSADSRASSIVPVSVHAPQLITPKVAWAREIDGSYRLACEITDLLN